MAWEPTKEEIEKPENKQVCKNCGNETFHVYITVIIDDARLFCAQCGQFWL